eukprot:Phypoly_transcript_18682.p1 GENE.Phypoly_transcript_18682~~Phypoly_transcript_18682.p1  ORF type:complete len:183 (+),score=20.16 Phypoly_transcript_18682:168-716(+)
MAAPRKVFTTAVIVMPPKELWGPIQAIRSKHDSAFDRWMPHVNLLFPFLDYDSLEGAADKLQKALSEVQPFHVTLNSFCHFDHAKNCVVWLDPVSDRQNAVKDLQSKVEATFPMCDDQGKKSDHGYTPHLTLGQFPKKDISQTKAKFAGTWKPIEFDVTSVYIIRRGKDTPFEIAHEVKLGQ